MMKNAHVQPRALYHGKGRDTPGAVFARLVAVLLGVVGVTGVWLFGLGIGTAIALLLFCAIALFAGRGLSDYPLDALGLANGVTTTRAAMIAIVAGAVAQPEALGWALFIIATVAFALDGVDGYLARRSGMATAFGARFDMEVDALFGAVLALIILSAGLVGPEILILGFLRYAFVAASYVLPWLNGSLPDSLRRKTVCVVQIAVLVAVICPLMPMALIPVVTWVGIAALVWSFGVDTVWLKRAAA